MLKTENQVWAFLVEQFNNVLIDNGRRVITEVEEDGETKIVITGWGVSRVFQPTIQGLQDKTIYLHQVSSRRVGTQGFIDVKDENGDWQTAERWVEEKMIQVSGFMKRDTATETIDTLTSGDIVRELMAYVNSALKVQEWKSAGYEIIRATDVRDIDYETDSGLNEKLPQFDFLLCIEQIQLKKIGKVDKITITTKRI